MKLISILIAVALSILACTAQTSNSQNMNEKKVLVAYFSATGTTKAKATAIAKEINATLYEITPATLYSDDDLDWRNKQSRSSMEMADNQSRPELGGKTVNAADYDVIFIGFPIWWDVCPHVVNTWIESQNLKGKTVIPFATSGGSSINNSQKTLRSLYPDCRWQDGKLLNGSAKSAAEWAESIVK